MNFDQEFQRLKSNIYNCSDKDEEKKNIEKLLSFIKAMELHKLDDKRKVNYNLQRSIYQNYLSLNANQFSSSKKPKNEMKNVAELKYEYPNVSLDDYIGNQDIVKDIKTILYGTLIFEVTSINH